MNQEEAQRLFKEANCFWFGEKRYNKVLPLYREALKHDPTDPVILYQLANVLWAFEKFDEMTEVLELAQQHQERLSDDGKHIFAAGKEILLEPVETPPFGCSLPIPADSIDLETLESMRLSHSDWYGIALAAETRRMFSLAADAYERSMLFTDFDTERDRNKMETKNKGAFRKLEVMRSQAQK
jgi:tetratricopeptide (TPR) repeat protein